MNRKHRNIILIPLLVVIAVIAFLCIRPSKGMEFQHDEGFVFGTVYSVTYQYDEDIQNDIEDVLALVDGSLSPFNEKSVITAVNNNKDVVLDSMFVDVFTLASKVYEDTKGAFDITVAPLVNAWGFGFKNGTNPSKEVVDSLCQIIGFDKVRLEKGKIVKADSRIMLDCSAIAKGYGVDAVANMLRSRGIKNFMVEIGGEVVTSGVNKHGNPWRIGVTKPDDDSLNVKNELQTVLCITDKAMATSGNYRNFYYRDGKKYAHTIDPKTGYPIQHSLLSATVIADDCATADAYATSFMVLGIDAAKRILNRHPEMMAYFIYAKPDGSCGVWFSPKMQNKIVDR